MNKNYIIGILSLVILLLLGFIFYQNKQVPPTEPILLHDTIRIDSIQIQYKTKTQYITKDSIQFVYQNDTIFDTCYVYIPIEHKTYKDQFKDDNLTLDYAIDFSGYNASINNVDISYDFKYQPPKQKKIGLVWCVGPYVGYGFQFNRGQYTNGIEVGIGGSIGIGGIIK